jgi:hypothetical protein
MNGFRKELGCPDLPILIGGLGDFLTKLEKYPEFAQNYLRINAVLRELGKEYAHCAFVCAEGLGANPDNLHFNSQALKEFGIRYYQAYSPFSE